jgi:type IV secretion system protein VirD4
MKVHFILDEAASLGHMEALDDAVDKFRGYGVRLLLLYQSLGQLKKCFPDGQDQTLLSNVTQVFMGVNDQGTATYVSDRLGEQTIIVESGGEGDGTSHQNSPQGNSHGYSTNRSRNWQQLGRKLLKPEEVTGQNPRVAITLSPGLPPIATWTVRSYENNFHTTPGMGLWRAAIDTTCLFLTAALLAILFTGALINQLR